MLFASTVSAQAPEASLPPLGSDRVEATPSEASASDEPSEAVDEAPSLLGDDARAVLEHVWRASSGGERAFAVQLPGTTDLLVSAASLAARGGPVRVRRLEGESERAEVLGSGEHGLLLLRVADERPAPFSLGDATLGSTVYIVAGDVTAALISSISAQGLRISAPCPAGAPIINETGNLVALCRGQDSAILGEHLAEVASQDHGDFARKSPWRVSLMAEVGLRLQQAYDPSLVANLSLRIVGWNRFGLALRAGFSTGARSSDGLRESGSPIEVTAEAQLHQPFRLGAGSGRWILGAGLVYRREAVDTLQSFVDVDPSCDLGLGSCPGNVRIERTSASRNRFLPSLRVALELERLQLSYTAIIDPSVPSATTHTVGLGAVF
ncbi:MAG: hypothetical protein AAF938_06215 [Myxococcota bacterium]